MESDERAEDRRGQPARDVDRGSQIEGPEEGSPEMQDLIRDAEKQAEKNVDDKER